MTAWADGWTAAELAVELGCTPRHVRRTASELRGWRLPSGEWRFPADVVRDGEARLAEARRFRAGLCQHCGLPAGG